MRAVDFQDSVQRIPAQERLQQQHQQQPSLDQAALQRTAQATAEARIDRPTAQDPVENLSVERQKRDREFRKRQQASRKKKQQPRPQQDGGGYRVDLIG